MKTHNLVQGSPEWHAHRAQHFNASDAPAMLGCSPYKTRAQLLLEVYTGYRPEVDSATQRRFDDGHRFEALARPLAEAIIGEDLAPVVGSEGNLSASFDGLTMLGDTAFEHKSLNDELRACMKDQGNGYGLPKHYQVQMEQQLMVSGAERVLFMATRWEGEECVEQRHCWYASDPKLRSEIVAGWAQFAVDLATYNPPAASAVEKIVAEPVEALPAPVVTVSGQLALSDNFKVFEQRLRDFLATRLIREPKSDEDFVNLDAQIKAMKQGRESLKAAKAQMLGQVQPVDQAMKTADMLDTLLQQNVSVAERLLKDEKERRKGDIVAAGIGALKAHVDGLNKRLDTAYMPVVLADFGGVVKGLKSLASMENAVSTELARAKIMANEIADRIQANRESLKPGPGGIPGDDWISLFPDFAAVCTKSAEDFANLKAARVEVERQRRADERERIRKEEAEKLEGAQRAQAAPAPTTAPAPVFVPPVAPAANTTVVPLQRATNEKPSMTLGDIKARIAPLSIDAAGLTSLGFPPAATDKSAKLYHESDFGRMVDSIVAHLRMAQQKQLEAA